MAARHPLLEFIGSRYLHAQASNDELHLRALELIAAACVREWVDLPPASAAPLPAPQGWIQDSVPSVVQEPAAPQPQPQDAGPNGDGESWWGPGSDQADPDHVRGAWDPPARA